MTTARRIIGHPLHFSCLLFFCLLAVSLLPPAALAQAPAPARHALVIGNAAYEKQPLLNPRNDARLIASLLTRLGFAVTEASDLRRDDIGSTVARFIRGIGKDDSVIVFYAGHGMQLRGENYLLAVDAKFDTEFDVALNSISVSTLLAGIEERGAGVKILLLDSCRNNPYALRTRSGGGAGGLARMGEFAPSGTLISYSTRPGALAEDGEDRNSLYTSSLARHLATPGITVEAALKRVQIDVFARTDGRQEPWMEGGIRGEFVFARDPIALPSIAGLSGAGAIATANASSSTTPSTTPNTTLSPSAAIAPSTLFPLSGASTYGAPAATVTHLRGANGSPWNARLSLAGDRMLLRTLSRHRNGGHVTEYHCSGRMQADTTVAGSATRSASEWLFVGLCTAGHEAVEVKANRDFLLIAGGEGKGRSTHILRLEAGR